MIKRFFLALTVLAGLLSPALAAGTITISLTQRFDNSTHLPLSGGKIYFIQAGTTSTPQNAYLDSALTLPYANPLTLDSGGNIPQLFFADGVIKIRITNSLGVQQLVQDNIQVTGASSGGGGGGTVDPTTILATGDLKIRYGTGVLTGFVRANARTIGSATSGAAERANADCQALFEYLWGADANLAVSGGRGGSANADWVANKTIALPNGQGRDLRGLADMGGSTSTILDGVTFNTPGTKTTLGATGGASTRTITTPNLPPYTPTGTVGNPTVAALGGTQAISAANGSVTASLNGGGTNVYPANQMGLVTSGAFTGTAQGGTGTALETISPTLLITIYMKL